MRENRALVLQKSYNADTFRCSFPHFYPVFFLQQRCCRIVITYTYGCNMLKLLLPRQ